MERKILGIFIVVFGLINVILGANNNVLAEEVDFNDNESVETSSVNESSENALPSSENSEGLQEKPVEYVKGQLTVKLKSGHTLAEIQELNERYKVISTETVLNKELPSDETSTQLNTQSSVFSAKNDRWYWQLEKSSVKEKEAVEEENSVSSDEKEETDTADTNASNLENVFVQNVPEETDILQMAADYRNNPAVESAEPNYTQQE